MSTSGRRTALVAAGILLTRLLGLVRERVFAFYFGSGLAADAFGAALRIPNVIRNLLGEGTLSASFIPVYADLVERGREDEARQLAGTMLSALVLLGTAGALAGVLLAPAITRLIAIGFSPEAQALTTTLVRILFPMASVMVLSAWCLGVLNSHRRFFLSYAAPVVWNMAQIAVLVTLGARLAGADLVVALAWGALAGSGLQFVVQLPQTIGLLRGWRWGHPFSPHPAYRRVLRAWGPVVLGAGVIQISSIIDTQLASLLDLGAVANYRYAQMIALLPVSLFGISVAAVALPDLSRDVAGGESETLRRRMSAAVSRAMFFLIPSGVAFVVIGPELVGLILESGAFGADESAAVAGVLAMFGVGIPARGSIRLVASGHYALGDTKTPMRIAALHVAVAAVLAWVLMRRMGVPGIALGGSIGAYLNIMLQMRALSPALGRVADQPTLRGLLGALLGAGMAGGAALLAARGLAGAPVIPRALAAIGAFGLVYLAVTRLGGHREARRLLPF